MITENGSIKVSTPLDLKMQRELNKKSYILGITLSAIGGLIVAVAFVLYVIAVVLEKSETTYFVILICGGALLGAGIGALILVKKAEKTVLGVQKAETYEFFGDYFTIEETLNGEVVANVKVYNTQIIKSKESKNFLFFYINAVTAYPVSKSELTGEELSVLRKLFRLQGSIQNKTEVKS